MIVIGCGGTSPQRGNEGVAQEGAQEDQALGPQTQSSHAHGSAASTSTTPPGSGPESPDKSGLHGDGAPGGAKAAPVWTRTRDIMSTAFQVVVADPWTNEKEAAVASAFDAIAAMESTLSEWRDDSEISAVNASAGKKPVRVGADLCEVVRAGLQVSAWSEGAFDISWAALRPHYLFQPGDRKAPELAHIRQQLPLVDWTSVALFPMPQGRAPAASVAAESRPSPETASQAKAHANPLPDPQNTHTKERPNACRIQLKKRGMAIGTGSIAKGLSLDRAGQILRTSGINHYMISAGGQVQVHGKRGKRHWRVGIQHPRDPARAFAFLEVREGSLSTSGDYEHRFVDDRGVSWHHIIDPRTGLPARDVASVTFVTTEGMYADALSTASFVLGPDRAAAMQRKLPFPSAYVIIDTHGTIHLSPGVRESLVLTQAPLPGGRLDGFAAP